MNSTCPSDERLLALLSGEPSEDDRLVLAHLEGCESCAPRLVQTERTVTLLRLQARPDVPSDLHRTVMARIPFHEAPGSDSTGPSVPSSSVERFVETLRLQWRTAALGALCVALVVIAVFMPGGLAGFWYDLFGTERDEPPAYALLDTFGEGAAALPPTGSPLPSGTTLDVPASSQLSLAIGNRGRAEIVGPGSVRCDNDELTMRQGMARVKLKPNSGPFTVLTPSARVVVTGTVFTVFVASEKLTFVEVQTGSVRVETSTGRVTELKAGQRWDTTNAVAVPCFGVRPGSPSDAPPVTVVVPPTRSEPTVSPAPAVPAPTRPGDGAAGPAANDEPEPSLRTVEEGF